MGRDGQNKKIDKANERKGKVKRGKDDVNGQGGRGVPRPHTGHQLPMINMINTKQASIIATTAHLYMWNA